MSTPQALLPRLEALLREAGEIALKRRSVGKFTLKPDGSVVTDGDRAVEEFLRPELQKLVHGTNVWGEELGFEEEGPDGLWLVDPIDGTTNYAFGMPGWGISAGLVRGEEVLLGGVFLPVYQELYLAAPGLGATLNGHPLPPIPPGPIMAHEAVSYCETVLRAFPAGSLPGKMRCSGAFVIEGAYVASQRLRGLIGVREKLYDIAGSLALFQELGAEVRYADGSPFLLSELKKDERIPRPWIAFPAGTGFQASVQLA